MEDNKTDVGGNSRRPYQFLDRCKHCGSSDVEQMETEDTGLFFVTCNNCDISTDHSADKSYSMGIWNNRASCSPWIEIKLDDDFEYPHVPFLVKDRDNVAYLVENYIYPDSATVMINVAGCDVPISFYDCIHYMPIPEIKDDNV